MEQSSLRIEPGDKVLVVPVALYGRVTRVQTTGLCGISVKRGDEPNEVFYHLDDLKLVDDKAMRV